jgi:hypothetical protein
MPEWVVTSFFSYYAQTLLFHGIPKESSFHSDVFAAFLADLSEMTWSQEYRNFEDKHLYIWMKWDYQVFSFHEGT